MGTLKHIIKPLKGMTIQDNYTTSAVPKEVEHMRLPNGYGSVVHLSGNRRKPFMVRKTKGFKANGQPIYSIIGYTETREEGLMLLAKFNHEPWNINIHEMTFKDVYELFVEKKMPKLSDGVAKAIRITYKKCTTLYNLKYKSIRAIHMQDIIDQYAGHPSTQKKIKAFFYHLDKFAYEIDVISKQYSQIVTTESTPESTKTSFTHDQIDKLWSIYESGKYAYADVVMIFIYSGFRISELLQMKTENVDIENMVFIGGTKTESGKNRQVPIHSLIQPLVLKRYNPDHEYFIMNVDNRNGSYIPFVGNQFYDYWYEVVDNLGVHRTPHEARHTFRTLLDEVGANKKCSDMMMGHKTKDVGLRVYTHKTIEELREAIELIKR